MSYSDQHKKAMATIYQNVAHLKGVHFEPEELIHYIVGEFSEGDLERAIKAFKEGADLYDGTQTWKDALDTIRKEL